ncbi:2945_t:CDS:1, partial [Paraglomus brasilianum]
TCFFGPEEIYESSNKTSLLVLFSSKYILPPTALRHSSLYRDAR